MNDWLRLIIICLGTTCFGMIVIVLVFYFQVWLRAPKNQRKLPLHIWGIAVSYMVVVGDLLLILLERVGAGAPISFYAWSFGAAMIIGIYALGQIASQQRDRIGGTHEGPR